MVFTLGGHTRFITADPETYQRFSDALLTATNKALVLELIPDADVSRFTD
jgi:hypothetical protein